MQSEIEIDVEPNLRRYLPSIFKLLGDEKINWKNITRKYQNELNSRISRMRKTGQTSLDVEASLYDIITKVLNGDTRYFNLLTFFGIVFTDLFENTTDKERKLLKQMIYNVLINTDNKFFNFIGEFATLNNLKKSGYELIQTEQPIGEGKGSKRVDFTVKLNDEIRLIEVVNIHLPEILNDEVIERVFAQKITDKLNTKKKGTDKTFYLFPVLWGSAKELRMVIDFFKRRKFEFKNTYYPRAYISQIHESGELARVIFGKIDRLQLTLPN